MHITLVVDIGDVDTGTVTAPLGQFGANMCCLLGKVFTHPVQQIDAVGIIVAGNELGSLAFKGIFQRSIEEQIHGPAGGVVDDIVLPVLVAPAGIVQVREIEFVDAFPGHQIQ